MNLTNPEEDLGSPSTNQLLDQTLQETGMIDKYGLPTDQALKNRAVAPNAEETGYVAPQYHGVPHAMMDSLKSSAVSTLSGFQKSFGNDEFAGYLDGVKAAHPEWQMPEKQGLAGWLAYQGVNGLVTTAPMVAVGAMTGGAGVGFQLAAMRMTTFAQLFGDNFDKAMRDSGDMADPWTILGASVLNTGIQAAIETGLGPQQWMANSLRRAMTGELTREGAKKAGLMAASGFMPRIPKLLAAGLEEGSEEALQLLSDDLTGKFLSGKDMSGASDYLQNFAAGAWGGILLGGGASAIDMVAKNRAQKSLERFTGAAPDQAMIDTVTSPHLDPGLLNDPVAKTEAQRQFMAQEDGAFTAFGQTLPAQLRGVVPMIRNMAYAMAAEDGGLSKPSDFIASLKVAFVDESQLGTTAEGQDQSEIQEFTTRMTEAKSNAEQLQVLRETFKGFDRMVKSAGQIIELKKRKEFNDQLQKANTQNVAPLDEITKKQFASMLSDVAGQVQVSENQHGKQITRASLSDLLDADQLNIESLRAVVRQGGIDGVKIGSKTYRAVLNADFSLSFEEMAEPAVAAKGPAADTTSLLSKAMDPKNTDGLRASQTEIDIIKEQIRGQELARQKELLDLLDTMDGRMTVDEKMERQAQRQTVRGRLAWMEDRVAQLRETVVSDPAQREARDSEIAKLQYEIAKDGRVAAPRTKAHKMLLLNPAPKSASVPIELADLDRMDGDQLLQYAQTAGHPTTFMVGGTEVQKPLSAIRAELKGVPWVADSVPPGTAPARLKTSPAPSFANQQVMPEKMPMSNEQIKNTPAYAALLANGRTSAQAIKETREYYAEQFYRQAEQGGTTGAEGARGMPGDTAPLFEKKNTEPSFKYGKSSGVLRGKLGDVYLTETQNKGSYYVRDSNGNDLGIARRTLDIVSMGDGSGAKIQRAAISWGGKDLPVSDLADWVWTKTRNMAEGKVSGVSDAEKVRLQKVISGLDASRSSEAPITEGSVTGRGLASTASELFEKAAEPKKNSVWDNSGVYYRDSRLAVFFSDADAETIVHEWFHHLSTSGLLPVKYVELFKANWSHDIKGRTMAEIRRDMEAKGQPVTDDELRKMVKWTDVSEENAVREFLAFVRDGKIVDPQLRESFDEIRSTFSKVYQRVTSEYFNEAPGALSENKLAIPDQSRAIGLRKNDANGLSFTLPGGKGVKTETWTILKTSDGSWTVTGPGVDPINVKSLNDIPDYAIQWISDAEEFFGGKIAIAKSSIALAEKKRPENITVAAELVFGTGAPLAQEYPGFVVASQEVQAEVTQRAAKAIFPILRQEFGEDIVATGYGQGGWMKGVNPNVAFEYKTLEAATKGADAAGSAWQQDGMMVAKIEDQGSDSMMVFGKNDRSDLSMSERKDVYSVIEEILYPAMKALNPDAVIGFTQINKGSENAEQMMIAQPFSSKEQTAELLGGVWDEIRQSVKEKFNIDLAASVESGTVIFRNKDEHYKWEIGNEGNTSEAGDRSESRSTDGVLSLSRRLQDATRGVFDQAKKDGLFERRGKGAGAKDEAGAYRETASQFTVEPVRDTGKTLVLTHYSKEAGLTEIDPAFSGRGGLPGAERARQEAYPEIYQGRSYIYLGSHKKEAGLGPNKYTAKIDEGTLYDYEKDTSGLGEQIWDYIKTSGEYAPTDGEAFDTLIEKAVKDAGYVGLRYLRNEAILFRVIKPGESITAATHGNQRGQDQGSGDLQRGQRAGNAVPGSGRRSASGPLREGPSSGQAIGLSPETEAVLSGLFKAPSAESLGTVMGDGLYKTMRYRATFEEPIRSDRDVEAIAKAVVTGVPLLEKSRSKYDELNDRYLDRFISEGRKIEDVSSVTKQEKSLIDRVAASLERSYGKGSTEGYSLKRIDGVLGLLLDGSDYFAVADERYMPKSFSPLMAKKDGSRDRQGVNAQIHAIFNGDHQKASDFVKQHVQSTTGQSILSMAEASDDQLTAAAQAAQAQYGRGETPISDAIVYQMTGHNMTARELKTAFPVVYDRMVAELEGLVPGEKQGDRIKSMASEADMLAEQQKMLHKMRPMRANVAGGPEILTELLNSAKRGLQGIMKWTYGLHAMCKYLDDANQKVMDNPASFNNLVWAKFRDANHKIATKFLPIMQEYEAKVKNGSFFRDSNQIFTLPNGEKYSYNEMLVIYSLANGGTVKQSSMEFVDKKGVKRIRPEYTNLASWIYSNLGIEDSVVAKGIQTANQIVAQINGTAELKTQALNEIKWQNDLGARFFDEAAAVFKKETKSGRSLTKMSGMYTPMVRVSGDIHEADLASIFESIDGKQPLFDNLDGLKEFHRRQGGKGGALRLDYRGNFLRHIEAMVNYTEKRGHVADVLGMLGNESMIDVMKDRFGEDDTIMSGLQMLVKREMKPSGKWAGPMIGDKVLGNVMQNVYASVFPFNIMSLPTQLTSLSNGLAEMGMTPSAMKNVAVEFFGLTKFVTRNFSRVKSGEVAHILEGNEIYELVRKWSPSLLRRFPVAEADTFRRNQSFLSKHVPGWNKLIDEGNLFMELGDMAAVLPTWKVLFDENVKKISFQNMELTADQVMKKAADMAYDAVVQSQNPSTVTEKNLMQTGPGVVKALIPFSGQTFVLWHNMMNDIALPLMSAVQDSTTKTGAVKNMAEVLLKKQMLTKYAGRFLIPAILMGMVARRRPPEDAKEVLRDLVVYPFTALPIVGNVIWASMFLGWKTGGPIAFWESLASGTIDTIAKGEMFGGQGYEQADFEAFARTGGLATGVPQAFIRIVSNAIDVASHKDKTFDWEAVRKSLGIQARG